MNRYISAITHTQQAEWLQITKLPTKWVAMCHSCCRPLKRHQKTHLPVQWLLRKCTCTQLVFGDSIDTEGWSLQTVLLVRARQSMTHTISCKSGLSHKSRLTVTKYPFHCTPLAKDSVLAHSWFLWQHRHWSWKLATVLLACARQSVTHAVSCKSGVSPKPQVTC